MIRKEFRPVLIFNIIVILVFTFHFIVTKDYEFFIYLGVIIGALLLLLHSDKKVKYPVPLLWGLTFWSLIHMAGGAVYVNGERLYHLILIDLVGAPYYIFKYDQFAHLFGFSVATYLMFVLLKPSLKNFKSKAAIGIVITMAGMGMGALNEVIEFMVTIVIANSGVGGYINNALDLVFNMVAAIITTLFLLNRK